MSAKNQIPESMFPQRASTHTLNFTTTPVSGVLDSNTKYRLCADADCFYTLNDEFEETFVASTTSGCFLSNGVIDYIQTTDAAKILHVSATSTSVSGYFSAAPMQPGSVT